MMVYSLKVGGVSKGLLLCLPQAVITPKSLFLFTAFTRCASTGYSPAVVSESTDHSRGHGRKLT